MIAKLIVRGVDREQARARMVQTLGEIQSVGVQTNIAFLRRLMLDQAFAQADLDTGLIERRHDSLFPPAVATADSTLALAIAALLASRGLMHSSLQRNVVHADPWAQADGWRITGTYQQMFSLLDGETLHDLHLQRNGAHWFYVNKTSSHPFEWDAQAQPGSPGQYALRIRLKGVDASATVVLRDESIHVFTSGSAHVLQVHDAVAHAQDDAAGHDGNLTAPMPGKIISILVKTGDQVKAGDTLLVMEAMKMEHTITAPADGTIQEVFFSVGDQVADGAELIALGD